MTSMFSKSELPVVTTSDYNILSLSLYRGTRNPKITKASKAQSPQELGGSQNHINTNIYPNLYKQYTILALYNIQILALYKYSHYTKY